MLIITVALEAEWIVNEIEKIQVGPSPPECKERNGAVVKLCRVRLLCNSRAPTTTLLVQARLRCSRRVYSLQLCLSFHRIGRVNKEICYFPYARSHFWIECKGLSHGRNDPLDNGAVTLLNH